MRDTLRYLKRLVGSDDPASADRVLLERFVTQREEAAFAALVERHGPLVWSVCRSMLPNAPEAEDAFQAVFLVLVRKADSIRRAESLASWLHRVAVRIALEARRRLRQRQAREQPLEPSAPPADPGHEATQFRERLTFLREEIDRLPESYRTAVVACYLLGQTNESAAQELGWPIGTLKIRLTRARELLRTRLLRRGVDGLPGLLVGVSEACGAVPAGLTAHAVESAMLFAAGESAVAGSAVAEELAKGALQAMSMHRVKVGVALGLMMLLLGVGVGLTWARQQKDNPESKRPAVKEPAKPVFAVEAGFQVDGVDPHFVLSKQSTYLAAPLLGGKGLLLYDVKAEKKLALEQPERFLSAVFAPDGKSVWLGTTTGEAKQFSLPQLKELKSLTLAKGRRIEGLAISPDGKLLGWNDRKKDKAGLHSLADEKPIVTWDGVDSARFGYDPTPHVHFTSDPERVLFYRSNVRGLRIVGADEGGLVVWNHKLGKAEAVLNLYVPKQTAGFTLVPGGLIYGTRLDTHVWEIRHRDLKTGKERSIARTDTLHFLDLFASPSGKYLAEWDGEKDEIRLFDPRGKEKVRKFGDRTTGFVGWVAHGNTELLATIERGKPGLHLFDPITGKRQATFAAVKQTRIQSAILSEDGKRLVVQWWSSQGPGTSVEYHLSIYRATGFSKPAESKE